MPQGMVDEFRTRGLIVERGGRKTLRTLAWAAAGSRGILPPDGDLGLSVFLSNAACDDAILVE